MTLRKISPEQARVMLDQGAILIDIREADEHATIRITDAQHHPLSKLGQDGTIECNGKPVIFHCLSGMRTTANSGRLGQAASAAREVYLMEGGLNAWRKAGLPVATGQK